MWFRVVAVNEAHRPLAGVVIEALDLTDRTVTDSVTTNRSGEALISGLTGPHFFRPRVRRTSGNVGGRSYTGKVEVQVVGFSTNCMDYIVDPDGGGTHLTLALAVADAISNGGDITIWMCQSVTISTSIDIGGIGANDIITVTSVSGKTVVITADNNTDIFTQDSNGGQTTGGLVFRELGFDFGTGDLAVLDINASLEIKNLKFYNCDFLAPAGNSYLVRQDSTDSMGSLQLEVVNCTGQLDGFYKVGGSSSTYAPDRLIATDNILPILTEWWDGGSAFACPDSTSVSGGYYGIQTTLDLQTALDELHFSNLHILASMAGPLFDSVGTNSDMDHISFTNLHVRFSNASGVFCDLDQAGGNSSGLFLDSIFGYAPTGTDPTGTFVTIDSAWGEVHVGDIYGARWPTQYTGPDSSGYGSSHALLDGLMHTDSVADGVTAGSIIIGSDTPKWDELVISVPGANVLNTLGIANGETTPSWKTVLDGTNPADIAESASPGTSLVFSHRDHVHDHPDLAADIHTVYLLADGTRALSGDLDFAGNKILDSIGAFFRETANASADRANEGQIWVKNTSPNTFWFTNEDGTDFQIGPHTLLNASTHSDTASDGVTQGSLIVGNGTPAWDELVTGAVGTVLVTDGTDPSWSGSPAFSGTLTVDTINEYTGGVGVEVESVILRDGLVWGQTLHPELGIGDQIELTLSGNEITDKTRGAATEGDGCVFPDSSFGIWEATTNLVANGGFETNNNGWTATNGSIVRSTVRAKFGNASGLCTADGVGLDITFAITLTAVLHPLSMWVYVPSDYDGTDLEIRLSGFGGAGGAFQQNVDLTLTDQWQHVVMDTLTPNAGDLAGTARLLENGSVTNGKFVYIDGVQVEAQPIVTPYVETDGGTASRTAARVRADVAGVLDATQGWFAARLRMGWLNTDDPSTDVVLARWADADNDIIELRYDTANDQWELDRQNAGTGDVHTFSDSFSEGDMITVIGYWTGAAIALSIDGAAFTTTAQDSGDVPTLAATTVDIGSNAATEHIDSDVLWVAMGKGTLTDADARLINACGNTAPNRSVLPTVSQPTFLWDANTGAAGPDILLQDPDVFYIDYLTGDMKVTGGDFWFENDGVGLPYGNMYGHDMGENIDASEVAADVWLELTQGLTGGETNLVTFANNHELTVTKAGRYLIVWAMAVHTANPNDEVEGSICVNNTEIEAAANHTTIGSASKDMAMGGSTIQDLAAGDDISMCVNNHTASRDIVIEHVTCSLMMVGGT